MPEYGQKNQGRKGSASGMATYLSGVKSVYQLVDQRPESLSQRKLSEVGNKNPTNSGIVQRVRIRAQSADGSGHEVIDTDAPGMTLEHLKSIVPRTYPQDRALLQQAILSKWKGRVRHIADAHTQQGPRAGEPAAYDEIELGPFRGRDPHEVSARQDMDPVSTAMGLERHEEEALYRYSQGAKDERDSPGYMDRTGWESLTSAVHKIPSMGALGKVATVFRADRTAHFTKFLMGRIGKPCYIVHGAKTTAVGVNHLASAAFTANSHGMRKYEATSGKGMQLGKPQELALTRIKTVSARYIQYWGMHGASLDGGEVLIPAHTVTYYDGEPPNREIFARERRNIFTLIEVPSSLLTTKPLPTFDDFHGEPVPIRPIPRPARVPPPGKLKYD